ncbi:MAG TPA: amidase family protein [bacterium]|nr:amidase family protein [bacterium]
MATHDLCFVPAVELDRLIRSGDVSPVEITEAVLARIDRFNPALGAYITVTADLARAQAREAEGRARRGERRGPLDGIPYSVKDLEDTAGVRTTYGSKWLESNIPSADGAAAGRLRAAGGILLGKTNTPHFGHKDMSDNLIGPPCRNPWRRDRTSGGSSGGAASAVASGLGPLAHGSDGAGSIRCPASLCGVVGLKPSAGRVPYHPNPDYWTARSHNGPIARTVRDAALMLSALAGPDPRDPMSIDAPPQDYVAACDGDLRGLRVAWSGDLGRLPVDAEVRAITEAAARRFAGLGCAVEAPALGWPDVREPHRLIWHVGVAARQQDRAREHPDWFEPSLMRMIVDAGRISALDYGRALLARAPFYQAVGKLFEDYDLLLTPTMPVAAWPVEPDSAAVIEGRAAPTLLERLTFTFPFNLTGHPAVSVPCGWTREGLPVGLQIVGRWHADAAVLRAAAGFEAIQPWADRRPPAV